MLALTARVDDALLAIINGVWLASIPEIVSD
jgi:hypothetical protein